MDIELVGKTLADRYLIEEWIGAGAMGEVFRAKHVKIGKSFAVKVLHPALLADRKTLQRFEREAELAGTLKHPNIVGVVDVGETVDGLHYMVMELAVGEPLSLVIARGPMPAQRALPILRQLCDALHHAHDRGLVHRDFKPDNVILERRPDGSEFARIIDFGIAILRDDLSSEGKQRLTTSGVLLGTPQYLAPEQAFGTGDHRIDLFALGVVSYELLTGRLPFDGEGAEVARANLTMATPPMGVRVPFLQVDPLLEAFTLRLMSKSPELRPETGKEAREMLDLIERDRETAAELLGIEASTSTRRMMVARTDQSQPVVRVALDTGEAVPLARPRQTDQAAPLVGRPVSIAPPQPRSRRALIIGGTAAAAIAIGAILIATSGSSDDAPKPTTVIAPPAPRPPPPAPEPEPRPAAPDPAPAPPELVPEPTPAPVPQPGSAAPKPPRPIVKPKPKPPAPAPIPVEPTARELADLYVAVGRELKVFADKKGANAESLSHRYRLIKISDALATPERRTATARELAAIRGALR